MDEREAEARLQSERAATAQRLVSMSRELEAVAAAAAGSNLDDEHDPVGSTIAFEREQLAGLRSHTRNQLLELDAAVDRLRNGRYGLSANAADTQSGTRGWRRCPRPGSV
jgi:RNA polymerase-binding transcription factor DksA